MLYIYIIFDFAMAVIMLLFGNKKSRFIGRILGMILIAVGIWMGLIR